MLWRDLSATPTGFRPSLDWFKAGSTKYLLQSGSITTAVVFTVVVCVCVSGDRDAVRGRGGGGGVACKRSPQGLVPCGVLQTSLCNNKPELHLQGGFALKTGFKGINAGRIQRERRAVFLLSSVVELVVLVPLATLLIQLFFIRLMVSQSVYLLRCKSCLPARRKVKGRHYNSLFLETGYFVVLLLDLMPLVSKKKLREG